MKTQATATIKTTNSGFVIYRNGQFYVQHDFFSTGNHKEQLVKLAKKYFTTGILRKIGSSTEIEHQTFDEFEFEHFGSVSQIVPVYGVFAHA